MRKHTKTRTGCMTCRHRRVKCDEGRPDCENCTQRNLDCAYSNHLGSSGPPGSAPQRPLGPETVCSCSLSLPPPRPTFPTLELEMKNLKLFHHFTTATYATLSMDDDVREIWRLVVPRIAFSYECVMHALLAMSALHLSFLGSPGESYVVAAAVHHGKALGLLRTGLPQHADALYAAGSLTTRYVYACPPVVGNKLPLALTWIPAFKVISKTHRLGGYRAQQGEFLPLLVRKMLKRGRYAGDGIGFPSSLFDLSLRGASGELDPEELEDDHVLEIYRKATKALELSWDQFWSTEPREAAVFMWPCFMPDEFVRFLQELRPRALVLLAHHCVMTELIDQEYWWIKGRGRGIDEIGRIEGVLEEKWKRWLDWPKCTISKGAG